MRRVFFHEDDYCQIEVLPVVNLRFCLEQAGAIEKFSAEHWAGAGWDEMYVRHESPIALENLEITLADIRAALSPALAEYDQVLTGYGQSYRQKCDNVYAFGNDDTAKIFVSVGSRKLIDAIWCSHPLVEVLKLPQAERLLLADWYCGFICPLRDRSRLLGYLEERGLRLKRDDAPD